MKYRLMRIGAVLLCGAFAIASFAQNANSTITGTVEDVSGAVVPGATVNLTNVGTGQQLSTTSKGDGFYVFTNLNPANYKISVTMAGFAEWAGVLTLRVSQAAEVNPQLVAASISTKVTVRDVTPVIDRINPTLADVKNATTIETLPVQNRSILNVLAFSPGVVANNYGGSGAGLTRVNGIPGGSMAYLVDGQTMANRYNNELQSNPQPLPTFQEVKIITSNGDAQYGRPGVVELVTKSGTNQFHGQLFELNQNNYLRAREAFSGPTINYLMHNEFGGQVGGPVRIPKLYNGKDKTFFFVDLEGIRENGNASRAYIVPPADMRNGDLSQLVDTNGTPITVYDPNTTTLDPITGTYVRTPFPQNKIPAARLNPVVQKIFNEPYGIPLPNIDNVAFNQYIPNYRPTNASQTLRNKLYTAKVDQLFGPNRLAMRYTYTSSNTLTQSYLLNPRVGLSGGHNGAIVFTQVLGPRTINVARAGVQYNHNYGGAQPISPSIPILLGLPNYRDSIAWPSFYFRGDNDSYWDGIDRDNPRDFPDQTVNLSDQLTYNRGNHQMLFGFQVQNTRINTFEIGQPGGSYGTSGYFTAQQDPSEVADGIYNVPIVDTGSGLADFLLGNMDKLYLHTYPHYHTRQTEYSGYAQDNWRVTKDLTLNLGLRYQYWSPFSDAGGLQSTMDLSVPGGMVVYQGSGDLPSQTSAEVFDAFKAAGLPIQSAAQAGLPLSLWNMPKNNWEPRVGFAYQLDSNTVLRGGWGIYQWAMPLQQYQAAARKNPPFSYTSAIQPSQINGVIGDTSAAELEFPIASPEYGGPQPLDQFTLGSSAFVVDTSELQISQGDGWGIVPFDVDYKPQTVQEYNVTFARELPDHIGFQLSYIGNHSTNLLQFDPINYLIPRQLCPNPNCTPQERRAYPNFSTSAPYDMDEFKYDGYSNTNSLQAQIQRTFGSGLLLQAYFTWQKTLTTTESSLNGNQGAEVLPAALTGNASYSERQRAVYAPDPSLPTKTFSFNAHYEFPFGEGKRFLGSAHGFVNKLVSGYNISPFFLWHSGFYFSPYYTPDNSGSVSGTGRGIVLAPGRTGILPKSQRTRDHWFDASVYDPNSGAPYANQTYILQTELEGDFRNNIPKNYMTGPGFNEMDATIYKLTPITKNSVLDIEAQIFNVFNHQNLGLPNSQGSITSTTGMPRLIQLQAKYIF